SYWQRYGIPLMLTETSIEGQPINREIWLEQCVEDVGRLRQGGIPMVGLIWWPMLDQSAWDGGLTRRIGKIYAVGLLNLKRQRDGTLSRNPTLLVKLFKRYAESGDQAVGALEAIHYPSTDTVDEQLPPIGEWIEEKSDSDDSVLKSATTRTLLPKAISSAA